MGSGTARTLLIALLSLAAVVSFLPAQSTYAAPFTVDSSADAVDAAPGDGVCATQPLPDEGIRCTLRAAVMEANALAGAHTVTVPTGIFRLTNGVIQISRDVQITGNGVSQT